MSAQTHIEWTDATWNPLVGCTKVSPGCDHCYAETLVNRFAGHNKAFPNRFDVVTLRDDKMLTQPLRWRTPKRIFVNSLSDLFHKDVPDAFVAEVFAVMMLTPQHTYQLLTKRHGRMRSLLSDPDFRRDVQDASGPLKYGTGDHSDPRCDDRNYRTWPLPNVWLGVSVEDQGRADLRVNALLETPAAVHWLSMEPLLGPVDLAPGWLHRCDHAAAVGDRTLVCRDDVPHVDWVVVGGESGRGARPMHPDWARSLRDQCAAADVPFLMKQWGEYAPRCGLAISDGDQTHHCSCNGLGTGHRQHVEMVRIGKKAAGRELDGVTHDEYPIGGAS